MNRISPAAALMMLLMFKQRRVELSAAEFDLYFGTVCEVLEQVNDEKYRLTTPES